MTDLTAIKTPFGLLDRETQEALKAHGGPLEIYSYGNEWVDVTWPAWDDLRAYRVKPAPLTPDSIDWSHVAPEYRWMARDEGGAAFFYEEEPSISGGQWHLGGDCESTRAFASYRRGTVDWRDSLVRRPE